MLRAIFNKSWKQRLSKQQLCGHSPPISKTIQIRRIRHSRLCWRNKDKLISDFLLWTPSHRRTSVGWPTKIHQQQLCAYTGCSLEDLQEAVDDCYEWRERELGKSMLASEHDDIYIYIYIYREREGEVGGKREKCVWWLRDPLETASNGLQEFMIWIF